MVSKKILVVEFDEDNECDDTLEYLEEAIEQAGGFIRSQDTVQ